jgi:hypothetical protein
MHIGRIALVILSLTTAATADVQPTQRWSFGIGAELHASRVSGLDENGYGPQVELAFGHRNVQYFLEGSASYATLGAGDGYLGGGRWRAGVGARYLPYSFSQSRAASTDLSLEAFAGIQRFEWDDGDDFQRPEAGVGIGIQRRRFLTDRQVVLRATIRAALGSLDRSTLMASCRGSCPEMPEGDSNAGLTAVLGMQW